MNVINVLLVEDNPADIELTRAGLEQSKFAMHIEIAENGEIALDKLRAGPLPDLILLDLNMPKMDGRQFLDIVKNDEQMKIIPVVVLTSSEAVEDIEKSYLQHANCYIQKPVDFNKFAEIVQAIDDFWFTVVKLPMGDK